MASLWLDGVPVDFSYNRVLGVLKTLVRLIFSTRRREKVKFNIEWRRFYEEEHHNKYCSPNFMENIPLEKIKVA
jgi:hypothetical protein